ncbi:hypothetical protein PR003_g17607 [Phytophthora rubi]|uniref:Uncharacterized protein n=1 Tax=Phytophthora rubi TaxID=129364 RepID=A0A6A3I2J6_9STRA|nr:hypothetical protein PR001_g25945 [Phytophthora rubi]KAE9320898.1 hypothetical protein PR003_g17607 [Phytophthora rubi]
MEHITLRQQPTQIAAGSALETEMKLFLMQHAMTSAFP